MARLASFGAWRSLVARTVRVGEVPGSNPGAPIVFTRIAIVVAVAAATLVAAPAASAHIYWASKGNANGIGRANLDGSNVKPSFIGGQNMFTPGGVAVDSTHIYWGSHALAVDQRTSSIARAKLDGTGVTRNFAPVTGLQSRCGLAAGAGHVYWTNNSPITITPSIGRVNLDGSGVNQSFIPQTGKLGSCGIATDGTSLFWGPPSTRAKVDGSAPATLPGGGGCGFAVSSTHVYWVVVTSSPPVDRTSIARAKLDGTEVKQNLIGNASGACGLAADANHLYWADSLRGSIARSNLDGTKVEFDFIRDTGAKSPCGVAVDSGGPVTERLKLGRPKLNRHRGTARLPVKVPTEGLLSLRGHDVRTVKRETAGADKLHLRVKLKDRKLKQLKRRGRAKTRARVSFKPGEGDKTARSRKLRLVKR